MLTHVQIVHVPVLDQDRAKAFYVDMLGLVVVSDMDIGPHGRWLQVAPEGASTSLALVPGDSPAQTGTATVVFESTDIEADAQILRTKGVDLPNAIERMPWAAALRFEDPDGNQIAIQTPTAPGR
ncbi:glyoxalase superfamily protein [Leucobacter sp. 7(1)]|uniref:glyoxalase superfamily protein n=1 Tax=Leucobacter sp. 7(1) TaxID=1255613 RepID=UPI000B350FDC|nr:glyoxalase superfamily protein [Leucobacter sp. 7(1)]